MLNVELLNKEGVKTRVFIEQVDTLTSKASLKSTSLFERVNKEDGSSLMYHLDKRDGVKKVLFYVDTELISFMAIRGSMSADESIVWFVIDPSYRVVENFLVMFNALQSVVGKEVKYLKIMNERGTNDFSEVAESLNFKKLYSVYVMRFLGDYVSQEHNQNIQKAIIDDLKEMTVVGMECFSTSYQEELQYNSSSLNNPDVFNFVYKQAGNVVGMVSTRIHLNKATIADLAVLTSQRRQGIGRALLNYTTKFLLDMDKEISLSVKTESEGALRIYENAGFKQFNVNDFYKVKLDLVD